MTPLKYPLTFGFNHLTVQGGLYGPGHAAFQGDNLVYWNTADLKKSPEPVTIFVALTGEILPEGNYYTPLGTACKGVDAHYVVHLYHAEKKR